MRKIFFSFLWIVSGLFADARMAAERLIELSFCQDTQAVEQLFQEMQEWDLNDVAGFKKELQEALAKQTGRAFNETGYGQLVMKMSGASQATAYQNGNVTYYHYQYNPDSIFAAILDWLTVWLEPIFPFISTWLQNIFPDLSQYFYHRKIAEYKELVVQGEKIEPYRQYFEKIAFGKERELEIDPFISRELFFAALQVSGGAILLMAPYDEVRAMGFFLIKDGFTRGVIELKHIAEELGLEAI